MSEALQAAESKHEHLLKITVNKKPVEMAGPTATGLQIKEAAIAQGIQIGLDFELKELLPDKERKIIGDADSVTITKASKFVATASDDNS